MGKHGKKNKHKRDIWDITPDEQKKKQSNDIMDFVNPKNIAKSSQYDKFNSVYDAIRRDIEDEIKADNSDNDPNYWGDEDNSTGYCPPYPYFEDFINDEESEKVVNAPTIRLQYNKELERITITDGIISRSVRLNTGTVYDNGIPRDNDQIGDLSSKLVLQCITNMHPASIDGKDDVTVKMCKYRSINNNKFIITSDNRGNCYMYLIDNESFDSILNTVIEEYGIEEYLNVLFKLAYSFKSGDVFDTNDIDYMIAVRNYQGLIDLDLYDDIVFDDPDTEHLSDEEKYKRPVEDLVGMVNLQTFKRTIDDIMDCEMCLSDDDYDDGVNEVLPTEDQQSE